MEKTPDLKYFPETFDMYKHVNKLEQWVDFPEIMTGLDYKMDCCESFDAYREKSTLNLKPAHTERERRRNILYLLEHAERQIVGNYLFSKWRQYTHWNDSYNEYDVDFLRRIIAILEKAYEREMEEQNEKDYDPADKFTWKEGDLEVVQLVYKGKIIKLKPGETLAERKAAIDADTEVPVQAFVANIAFPKSLEEVMGYADRGNYNVEDILMEDNTNWTVPNWAKLGDVVFFMHSKTAIQTIRKLCTALKNTDEYDEEDKEYLQEWLDRGRELYNDYGGKIYAVGRVCGSPKGKYEHEDDDLSVIHWKTRIYADIDKIWLLDHPVDISEFNDFIFISRHGSITAVFGEEYEKLKSLIIQKNGNPPDYFAFSKAVPVPLARINEENWLSVTNQYRRSFLLEQQFRSFYVNRFLSVLGDQKKLYRECRCKKEGIPDSFVDNIILFN